MINHGIKYKSIQSDQRLRKLDDRMAESEGRRMTLAEAAELACLEQHYFSTYFHDRVGVTFSCWQQSVRIQRAKRMLANNDLTITQVSFKLGYKDPTNFARFFRKHAGTSPSAYKALCCRFQCQNRKS